MERPLTSWKEIATHFNKSVRTVQRWEQQFGLPVRRPDAHNHGIVLAFPSELDTWLRTHVIVRAENGDSAQTMAEVMPTTRTMVLSCSLSDFHATRTKSTALAQQTHELLKKVQLSFDRLKKNVDRSGELYVRFGKERQRAMAALAGADGEEPARSKAPRTARAS